MGKNGLITDDVSGPARAVGPVCLSVCLCVRRITFDINDAWPRYLVSWFNLVIVPKTYSKVMVIGQSSWSRDETVFQGDALLADCRVLCATVVGATSSEDFLIYKALVSRREHKSRENGRDESLHNLEWRTLMQMPPPQILSFFKIQAPDCLQ